MKINKDEIRKAWTLTINASSEKWVYSDGCVKNYKGEIIAYICVEGTSPIFNKK